MDWTDIGLVIRWAFQWTVLGIAEFLVWSLSGFGEISATDRLVQGKFIALVRDEKTHFYQVDNILAPDFTVKKIFYLCREGSQQSGACGSEHLLGEFRNYV